MHQAGELTPVWVPDQEHEAVRDLTRAREDMKHFVRQDRQRLCAFLLRHGGMTAVKASGPKLTRWLEGFKLNHRVQQTVFQEYIDSVKQQQQRVADLEQAMHEAHGPVVEGLMTLRGCRVITAMKFVAELADITRFDSPRQLMKYLGLEPSKSSSGPRARRGGITKTGNGHVRRVLVEAAWCYRFPARKTAPLQRRAEQTCVEVQVIAWKAQKRLCGRYQALSKRRLLPQKTCTAVARELTEFIWAITCEVMPKKAAEANAQSGK